MGTELELWHHQQWFAFKFSRAYWEIVQRVGDYEKELEANQAALEAGTLTRDEAFGTGCTAVDEFRMRMYDRFPSMPARYKLPKHWHWMGDSRHNGQQKFWP